jgi:hypothetical protein
LLADRPVHFVDNEAAKFALVKGYSSDLSINALLTVFWAHQTQQGHDPWFERVSTKANISDAVSRADMTEATAKGWQHVDLDLGNVWPILLRACSDMVCATTQASADITAALRPQVEQPWSS